MERLQLQMRTTKKRVHVNRIKPLYETMLWKDEETDPFEKIESRNQHEQHAKTTPVEENNNNEEEEESSSLSTSEDEVLPEIQKAERRHYVLVASRADQNGFYKRKRGKKIPGDGTNMQPQKKEKEKRKRTSP